MTEIKIEPITPVVKYIADGETNSFEFNFIIFDENDLKIYIDSVEKLDGFTVNINEDGTGTVNFTANPVLDQEIVILRNLEVKRVTDFKPYASLKAEDINYELDYLTAVQQDLDERVNRSLKVPLTSEITDLELPIPKAGYALVWNETEDGFENSEIDIAEEVAIAEDAATIAEDVLFTMTSMLGEDPGAGYLGLANNMLTILKKNYPEAFDDFDYINETADATEDWGLITVTADENLNFSAIIY